MTTKTKRKTNEALSIDDIMKKSDARREAEDAKRKAEIEAKKNAPKITSIWIKKLNINRNSPMNDTADIQLTWSDGKVEDTAFPIGTSGETLGTASWDDPNEMNMDADEITYKREVGDGGYKLKDKYQQMDTFYRDIVNSLKRASGGKNSSNPYKAAGVKITDEDVRVCMVRFGFVSQPDIKWFYGKDKYEDPVWAFSRVRPDPSVVSVAKLRLSKSYDSSSHEKPYKGREIFNSGNTTIYKLF